MDLGDREYTNGEITVFWRPGKCIHATTCYRDLIEVFNPRKKPWINMKGASTKRIIEVINKCPTEALSYKWNDESKNVEITNEKNNKIKQALAFTSEAKQIPVKVQVMSDGPLVVQGSFAIINSDGSPLRSMTMTSFCRCGATQNIPFCDGSHRKIGFKSDI
jgi:uncharacterized Fe-S cluster protein YjdI